jgi:large subunit ribosomal protein L5
MTDNRPTRAARAPKAQATGETGAAPKEKKTTTRAKAPQAEAPAAEQVVMAEATEATEAPAAAEVSEMTEAPAAAEAAPEAPAGKGKGKSDGRRAEAPAPAAPLGPHGLSVRYHEEIVPALTKEFGYRNPMEVPRLAKIVVNIGMGEALTNAKALDAAVGDLASITGQKPIVTRARRSIAQFRLRTGNPIGAKVTLRGQRMWDFLERLTRLALPRIRDFRGVPGKSFDGRGNYSLGLREQLAFPEIDYDKIDRLRGLEVSIVTTAHTDEESKRLLQLLGMPFAS